MRSARRIAERQTDRPVAGETLEHCLGLQLTLLRQPAVSPRVGAAAVGLGPGPIALPAWPDPAIGHAFKAPDDNGIDLPEFLAGTVVPSRPLIYIGVPEQVTRKYEFDRQDRCRRCQLLLCLHQQLLHDAGAAIPQAPPRWRSAQRLGNPSASLEPGPY